MEKKKQQQQFSIIILRSHCARDLDCRNRIIIYDKYPESKLRHPSKITPIEINLNDVFILP